MGGVRGARGRVSVMSVVFRGSSMGAISRAAFVCVLFLLENVNRIGGSRTIPGLKSTSAFVVTAADVQYDDAGYTVTTVFDGNKREHSIYKISAVESEDYVYAIDSTNSQLLKIRLPVDQSTEIVLLAGSSSGQGGYRDGPGESALLNRPKGLAVGDNGNVYVADTNNGVIRKFTPAGYVTTVAGQNKTGYVDGKGKDALFSADFDVTYLPSSCSLLVSDRGDKRLRIIELLPPQECNPQEAVGGHLLESLGILLGVIVPAIFLITGAVQYLKMQQTPIILWRHWGGNSTADVSDGMPTSGPVGRIEQSEPHLLDVDFIQQESGGEHDNLPLQVQDNILTNDFSESDEQARSVRSAGDNAQNSLVRVSDDGFIDSESTCTDVSESHCDLSVSDVLMCKSSAKGIDAKIAEVAEKLENSLRVGKVVASSP